LLSIRSPHRQSAPSSTISFVVNKTSIPEDQTHATALKIPRRQSSHEMSKREIAQEKQKQYRTHAKLPKSRILALSPAKRQEKRIAQASSFFEGRHAKSLAVKASGALLS
jgi:hypothetical protein